jgi:hypothetical protein
MRTTSSLHLLNYPLKKEFTNVEVCDENSLKFAFVGN